MKVIAESAFNHNGDKDYLVQMAVESQKSGADYFTFQVMDVDDFCVKEYEKYELYKKFSLSFDDFDYFFEKTKNLQIEYIPCVLDVNSFKYIYNKGYKFLKLHATDISNEALLTQIVSFSDVSVILETQCATHFDINYAVKKLGDQVVCLMHGFSNYPTEVEDLQLNSLDYLFDKFKLPVGFADHSLDTQNIPLMSLAKGCRFLEKHITLSRNDRNLDYQVSLYPHEFSIMVSTIKHYQQALGIYKKHPTVSENNFRKIMYKKEQNDGTFKRSDGGNESILNQILNFDKENVGVALIARLKSKRLEKKVLKPLHGTTLIEFLYKRISINKFKDTVYLATSDYHSDDELADYAESRKLNLFRGHAESVIDRMLELAYQQKFGAIFRVTGDNPLTDPYLMEEMVQLYLDNDLDYVRVENVPFGVSAELFSTEYLWKLYMELKNPMHSEYLTWYVLNDNKAKKGVIEAITDKEEASLYNFSVDYQEDYDDVVSVISKLNNPFNSGTKEILEHVGGLVKVDLNKEIKLPESKSVLFHTYLNMLKNQDITIKKEIKL
ncbi:N-acetylneuraminate synthase family protein [uncultured Nonlabens sp.]|jgi:N,N'-diacetyllegionaminate synthase|uniref:N-acetylneuraminate synthase family protein n=1 Tax=uncultured Nonlabens sp. TaxID=859306 RepID=UPI0030D9A7FC|tara:strand:- start:33124 stop:34779 length:1656 start_codon:yes stop_codon:yes gene_type:complete